MGSGTFTNICQGMLDMKHSVRISQQKKRWFSHFSLSLSRRLAICQEFYVRLTQLPNQSWTFGVKNVIDFCPIFTSFIYLFCFFVIYLSVITHVHWPVNEVKLPQYLPNLKQFPTLRLASLSRLQQ